MNSARSDDVFFGVPHTTRVAPSLSATDRLTVSGRAVVYRLFDVGDEIDLERAQRCLASNSPDRVRPERGEAQALQISNPPLTFALGSHSLRILEGHPGVELSARVFDFGVISLRARIEAPRGLGYTQIAWNGLDQDHDEVANGLYIFRVTARGGGNKEEFTGRIVRARQ